MKILLNKSTEQKWLQGEYFNRKQAISQTGALYISIKKFYAQIVVVQSHTLLQEGPISAYEKLLEKCYEDKIY